MGQQDFPEGYWKDLFTGAVDPILLVAPPGGIIVEANRSAEHLTGRTRDELLGRPIESLFAPEVLARVPFRTDLLDQGAVLRRTRSLSRKDGSQVVVDMHSRRMADGTYQTILRDTTEAQAAVEQLRLSEEKFAKAFKSSPDAINLTRLSDGCYLEINEGFTQMTGYTSEDVVGRSALPGDLGIWDRAEDRSRVVNELKTTGMVRGYEARFRRKDGGLVIGMMSGRLIDIQGQACFLSVTRDITERKRTEEALRHAENLEALGVLAGGIAHDFNNLLTGIFGYMAAAREQLSPGSPAAPLLDKSLGVYDRAKALSLQLLTFAKGGAPVKQTVDLERLVHEVTPFALSGSNVKVTYELAPDLGHCQADAHQIGQVLDNLLINARQAMPEGGAVTLRAEVLGADARLPETLIPGEYVRITVTDTGPGIPPEVLPRIFDPFFTTKQQGSGLGLATAFSVAKRHGGHLEADSPPDRGARFTLYLPRSQTAQDFEDPKPQEPQHRPKGRVLVLDDEDSLREIAGILLEGLGCRHEAVATGPQAVARYRQARDDQQPFDLVILDLTISGGEGGVRVLEDLRRIDPAVKAVACSGYSDDPVMADPHRFGFRASLAKPYWEPELRHVLERVL